MKTLKKVLCLILAILTLTTLCACGTEANNSAEPNQSQMAGENNSAANENGAAEHTGKEEMKYPLPERKADGTYSVDLDSEQVIYDKNGIKVTYMGYVIGGVFNHKNYELTVLVENNGAENLRFEPYAAVLNGMTFGTYTSLGTEPIAKGTTQECIITVSHNDWNIGDEIMAQEIKCFELHFGFFDGSNVYGTPQTLIDNNVVYSFTKGEHDHRNDERLVKGELVYENEEIAIYLEKTFNEIPDKYYSNVTIINKTNRTIRISGGVECRYTVAPASPHYDVLIGFGGLIAPNSYYTSEVYLDEEWSDLDMNEIILDGHFYYATHVDTAVHEDDLVDEEGHEGLEKMNCFGEKVEIPVTVMKN